MVLKSINTKLMWNVENSTAQLSEFSESGAELMLQGYIYPGCQQDPLPGNWSRICHVVTGSCSGATCLTSVFSIQFDCTGVWSNQIQDN